MSFIADGKVITQRLTAILVSRITAKFFLALNLTPT